MTRRTTLRPTSPLALWAAALLGGGVTGALSTLLPVLKLNAMVLIGILVILAILGAGLTRGLVANLVVALVAGVLAVVAMWAVWFGFSQGWGQLASVLQQGPAGIERTLRHLGATTSYRVTTGGTTTVHTPSEVRLVWWIATGAMLAAPVLGALVSPRINRRRAAQSV